MTTPHFSQCDIQTNSPCRVSSNIVITSTLPWASVAPGFGGLGAYGTFTLSPSSGPAGSTAVTVSYSTFTSNGGENGYLQFRQERQAQGFSVDVPVIVRMRPS
jgi:hypothetical protein